MGRSREKGKQRGQGRTLDELKGNLIEIYNDINEGLVPD